MQNSTIHFPQTNLRMMFFQRVHVADETFSDREVSIKYKMTFNKNKFDKVFLVLCWKKKNTSLRLERR